MFKKYVEESKIFVLSTKWVHEGIKSNKNFDVKNFVVKCVRD